MGYWTGRQVCVTGGTGFLGYHLVIKLLEQGAKVRVLALPPRRKHPITERRHIDYIPGDIRDAGLVRQALDGCEVVFHAAGVVGVWGEALERMWTVHLDGTRNVLEASGPDTRIVHTSSIMTIGASRTQEVLDENSPYTLDKFKLLYCRAKRASEELALNSGRDVVVTNPGYLVGPEDYERSIMGRFCLRFWRGRIPLASPGGVNLVDVRDAADGHLLAARYGRTGERYILGGENHTFKGFLQTMAETAGFAPRALPCVPYWLLAAASALAELHGWLTGNEPYPAMAHVRLNRFHWFYRSDKAMDELGFRSRPLAETLRDTLSWFLTFKNLQPRGLNRWWLRPQVDVATGFQPVENRRAA